MPSGWFQIAWSGDVIAGAVKPIRYFDTELVLARTHAGELRLFDAYCPHMGAHLGYGGCMEGENIVCPYHGWQFDGTGENVAIPYSKRPNKSRRVRTWHVEEVGGALVMAWYHPDGLPPSHPVVEIPELTSPDYFPIYPSCTRHYPDIAMHPEWVSENSVDMAHFKFVHETPDVASMIEAAADGPNLNVKFTMPMKKFNDSATRGSGRSNIIDALADVVCWGIGMLVIRFAIDGSYQLQAQTPVDETSCDMFASIIYPRNGNLEDDEPTTSGMARVNMEFRQLENDIVIWSHRRMEPTPALTLEEARPFKLFGTWKKQFYPSGPEPGRLPAISEEQPAHAEAR